MDGLPCRGDSTRNVGWSTTGPPDPGMTLRQRLHTNLFVDRELGRDMTKVTEALHGSSSAQLRHKKKQRARQQVKTGDVQDEVEPSGDHEDTAVDNDVTATFFVPTHSAAATPVDAVTESGSTHPRHFFIHPSYLRRMNGLAFWCSFR